MCLLKVGHQLDHSLSSTTAACAVLVLPGLVLCVELLAEDVSMLLYLLTCGDSCRLPRQMEQGEC
jgi:hypothetical protein